MDGIEITVFDEIKDYKEKIYFFNFRQWIFAILIIALVVPTYLILKNKIGEEATSYIVIAIAGILGFIGFVKIHELPAEKILPFWFRHYLLFAKPIHYIADEEYRFEHQKNGRLLLVNKTNNMDKDNTNDTNKTNNANNTSKSDMASTKAEIREIKRMQKQEKLLEKAKKKYGVKETKIEENTNKNEIIKQTTKEKNSAENTDESELSKKLSKLSKEQQEALLKLLER